MKKNLLVVLIFILGILFSRYVWAGDCSLPNCTDFVQACDQLKGEKRLLCFKDWDYVVANWYKAWEENDASTAVIGDSWGEPLDSGTIMQDSGTIMDADATIVFPKLPPNDPHWQKGDSLCRGWYYKRAGYCPVCGTKGVKVGFVVFAEDCTVTDPGIIGYGHKCVEFLTTLQKLYTCPNCGNLFTEPKKEEVK